MSKKVYAFDLGKASIGYCAREDFNIMELGSLIIETYILRQILIN